MNRRAGLPVGKRSKNILKNLETLVEGVLFRQVRSGDPLFLSIQGSDGFLPQLQEVSYRMPFRGGYPVACLELLRLIPGVKVRAFSDGCCGLVGTFGMKKKNFECSMAIGQRLFKEILDSKVDRISTGCGACKLQIFQGTHQEAVHPISLLASAYKKSEQVRSIKK
jgi:hypothetical protein